MFLQANNINMAIKRIKKPIEKIKEEVKVEKKVEKKVESKENLVKVLDRITKERLIIDANKEKDFKDKYLHIGGMPFRK